MCIAWKLHCRSPCKAGFALLQLHWTPKCPEKQNFCACHMCSQNSLTPRPGNWGKHEIWALNWKTSEEKQFFFFCLCFWSTKNKKCWCWDTMVLFCTTFWTLVPFKKPWKVVKTFRWDILFSHAEQFFIKRFYYKLPKAKMKCFCLVFCYSFQFWFLWSLLLKTRFFPLPLPHFTMSKSKK